MQTFLTHRHGLFAKTGQTLDALVRISDFGATKSKARFARMAVKVPLASSWAGEVNLLTTESLDTFPIPDYKGLASFAHDSSGSTWSTITGAIKSFGRSVGGIVTNGWRRELVAKTYYSQLPYALGSNRAMKFAIKSRVRQGDCACCTQPTASPMFADPWTWAGKRAKAMADFLKKCDATFDVQMQVRSGHDVPNSDVRWSEKLVTVATLTIPKQTCTDDWAVNKKLRDNIARNLGVAPDGVDKMFAFHPLMTDKSNRPLGAVNTFRTNYYPQFAKNRLDTLQKGVYKMSSGTTVNKVEQFDFSNLKGIY